MTPSWLPRVTPASLFQSRRKLFWLVAALVVVLDQLTKLWLWRLGDAPVDLIPGLLSLRSSANTHGAFGLGPASPLFFAAFAVLALVVVVCFLLTSAAGNALVICALGLLAGGALGNVADRLRLHYVRDFIDVHWRNVYHWPTFNVADSAICIGFALIALDVLFAGRSVEPAGKGGGAAPKDLQEGPPEHSSA